MPASGEAGDENRRPLFVALRCDAPRSSTSHGDTKRRVALRREPYLFIKNKSLRRVAGRRGAQCCDAGRRGASGTYLFINNRCIAWSCVATRRRCDARRREGKMDTGNVRCVAVGHSLTDTQRSCVAWRGTVVQCVAGRGAAVKCDE